MGDIIKMTPDERGLDLIGFNVVPYKWSTVKKVMAQFCDDEEKLRAALQIGHGIVIDANPQVDTILYFVFDQLTAEKLALFKVEEPTLLQALGTAQVIATSESAAICRFRTLMQEK